MASGFDTALSAIIVMAVMAFIGAKIYGHEKEHLDPIIDKIKGWFNKEEAEGDGALGPDDDFEIAFKGQQI